MGFTTIDVWRVFPDKIKIKYPLFEISFFVQCVIKINIQHIGIPTVNIRNKIHLLSIPKLGVNQASFD